MTTTRTSDWLRGNVLGLVATFLALGGTAYATHPGGANTISSGDIINGEVANNDLANNSIGTDKIADGRIKNQDLSPGASSSNTIADGGIQGVDVKNKTLTGAQIADDSLTGVQIDESTLSGIPSVDAWNLTGNSGTTAANFLGTTDNNPLNLRVNDARALRLEPASDGTNQSPNVIGGIADNQVTAGVHSTTIAGGGRSTPADPGSANAVTDNAGTVGGGANNQAGDGDATLTDAAEATVGGGESNTASGDGATVGGGRLNIAGGARATVPGGEFNAALGDFSLAAGRGAKANHQGALVLADSNPLNFASTAQDQFNIRSTGGARLVSGIDGTGSPTSGLELPAGTSAWSALVNGQPFDVRVNGARGLRIDPASDGTNQSPNVIGGIADNTVTAGVHSATIGGGGRGIAGNPASANVVSDNGGMVGGGALNRAGDQAGTTSDSEYATVAGGLSNEASGPHATVGGGLAATADGVGATVGGGEQTGALADHATVGGGENGQAQGSNATVGGGFENIAIAELSTVGGGQENQAGGISATVPGGAANTADGDRSLAAGRRAKANHNGAFVWADDQAADMASSAANQFIARASGEFFLQSDSTLDDQGGFINTSTGGFLSTGGTWTNSSDENDKTGFADVSPSGILDRVASLPVRTWHYKAEPDVRHIGPVAQDFYRAFEVGPDERHIASVDADGVALAAIKGLNATVRSQERRIAGLEARLAALERDGR